MPATSSQMDLLPELVDALRSLANEATGFLSTADRLTHGNTNMAVMQAKIDTARAVLAKIEAS